jgi:hypothetical protein
MFCLLAFIVLGVISVFNAAYRDLAKEAYDCVFRRITLRPCNTGFKEKMQAKLVGKMLSKSVWAARILNKNFELFSWILFLSTILSIFWAGKGLYNFYMYGSCNGLNQTGFCALDPTGENNKISAAGASCGGGSGDESVVTLEGVDLSLFPAQQIGAADTVVMIGCFACEYTRKAYPLVKQLLAEHEANFVFAHYPVKEGMMDLLDMEYCAEQQNPDLYWQLIDRLLTMDVAALTDVAQIDGVLTELGYDVAALRACEADPQTTVGVTARRIELEKTNIYGTPLIFVNEKGLVGPKPYRVYERML